MSFPLASGKLTGKVRRGVPLQPGTRLADRAEAIPDDELDRIEALERVATERGLTLLDLRDLGVDQLNISNIAARQEVRDLMNTLGLPGVSGDL